MYELKGGADFRNLSFHFLMRSLNLYAGEPVKIKPGQTKIVPMYLENSALFKKTKVGKNKIYD